MIYNPEFSYYYEVFDTIKEKNARIFISTIAQSRMSEAVVFEGYGNLTFNSDDKLKRYGTVECNQNFDRKKTNCIVFNLPVGPMNSGRYDKMIVFGHTSKTDSYYGFVLMNTKKNKSVHIADISGDLNDIIIRINQAVIGFNKCDALEKLLAEKRASGLF